MDNDNNNKPVMPYIMYVIAGILAFGSYCVYAGRTGHNSWNYFEYMEYMYFGVAQLLWLTIILLVIAATIMLSNAKGRREMTSSIIEETKSSLAESKADEITKLKGLLDSGALTQEEFETEKKKILNTK